MAKGMGQVSVNLYQMPACRQFSARKGLTPERTTSTMW